MIVVVNSNGPMASSSVSAIVEKFGYSNMPVRDYGLNEYLLGIRDLSDFHMRDSIVRALKLVSQSVSLGGVNMRDRDSAKIALTTTKYLQDDLNSLPDSYSSISEMYYSLRNLFKKSILYKNTESSASGHIEITTDLHRYIDRDIITAYEKEFGQVLFIHMHRDFEGWIESIASQRFSSKAKKHIFVLRWLIRRYREYEDKMKNAPGLHINFDDIFLPDNELLFKRLADSLVYQGETINWRNEKYDLYGRVTDFDKAFTKADTKGRYLSKITRKIIMYFYNKKEPSRLGDLIVYPLYLFDLLRFSIKRANT